MKTIPTSQIINQLHPDATAVSLRAMDGKPCREASVEELKVLVATGMVTCVIVRGHRQFRLTAPSDQAFRTLGETRARVKDLFHSDANDTVMRSDPAVPSIHKRHHLAHCFAWRTR